MYRRKPNSDPSDVPGATVTAPLAEKARSERAFCTRFQAVTGQIALSSHVEGLPASFLQRPVLSPESMLAALPLVPRTKNTLKRYVAHGPSSGTWTFRRLLDEVPRFGVWALLDVLEATRAMPRASTLAEATRTPGLEKALAIMAENLPAAEEDLRRRMMLAGLEGNIPDLRLLERAARSRGSKAAFSIFRRDGGAVAVPSSRIGQAKRLYALAMRFSTHWGPVRLDSVIREVGIKDRSFAEIVLSAFPAFRWLDRSEGWFWLHSENSRLVRTIEKILMVAPNVRVPDLLSTLFHRSTLGTIPPAPVVEAMCSDLPQLVVEDGSVRLGRPTDIDLNSVDVQIVKLFKLAGPRVNAAQVAKFAPRLRQSPEQLRRKLRASVLTLEIEPDVFRLIGAGPLRVMT